MNCNISPIAFYPSRAAQAWRSGYYQRNIAVVVGENLPAFIINDAPTTAPDSVEIYDPNTDTLVQTVSCTDIVAHTSTVDGVSVNSWIYQATSYGIWGFNTPGYYYLKIGNFYSDIIKLGSIIGDYVKLKYQFYDDIITADGTLISKYIVYQQIFETILWHPSYETTEEGKENNGIFYAMQQTLKKMCGFTEIVNVAQLDTLNLTRMADNVQIEARSNGVIRNFNTNTFEIKEKWESDDVASIDVAFDLFNIVRKYQKSNVAPEPLPVPTPPPPPGNYQFSGKTASNINSVTMKINGSNVQIPVFNKVFTYIYDTPLQSITTCDMTGTTGQLAGNVLSNVDQITEIDFSQSCGLTQAVRTIFKGMTRCTKADFTNCTFENVINANSFLQYAEVLTNLQLPDATFASIKSCIEMFMGCKTIKTISMPKALLSYIRGPIDGNYFGTAIYTFQDCTALETVNMPLADFGHTFSTGNMFASCKSLQTINMPAATFAQTEDFWGMFGYANGFSGNFVYGDLFPASTAKPTHIRSMFFNAEFESVDLTGLDLSACTHFYALFEDSQMHTLNMNASQFAVGEDFHDMFSGCEFDSSVTNLLASLTFATATDTRRMFKNAGIYHGAGSLSLTAATFANLTNAESMFEGSKFVNLYMANASFNSLTNANRMFYNCAAIVIDLSATLMSVVTSANSIFLNCSNLTTIHVPNSASWGLSFSLAQSANLNVNTMTELAAWCKYLSVGDSKTITINSTAKSGWLADPSKAAIYNAAVSTLNGKNWQVQ